MALQNKFAFKKNFHIASNLKKENIRDIAYSMDALVPGFYIWFGSFTLQLGGTKAEENYPGTINSPCGLAVVLPEYKIYTTYKQSYDSRQT